MVELIVIIIGLMLWFLLPGPIAFFVEAICIIFVLAQVSIAYGANSIFANIVAGICVIMFVGSIWLKLAMGRYS